MIQIDKTSDVPLQEQLAGRFRYLIASGRMRPGERMPATRRLADQQGISYHTVRKVYATLAAEGMIQTSGRQGYMVLSNEPPGKSERMEKGAVVMAEALRTLVGIGLEESEIDYLFQEQVALLDADDTPSKIVVAASFMELAVACADQLSAALKMECIPALLTELKVHADADHILVPYTHVRSTLSVATRAEVNGFRYELGDEAIEAIARLLDHETLGLITRRPDSIGPLTADIRTATRFTGQVVAISVQDGETYIAPLIRQSDMLVYTTGAEKRVRPYLERAERHKPLKLHIAASSVARIRDLVS